MRRMLFLILTLAFGSTAHAESFPWDRNVFNHLSVGVNVGTLGVGGDVAMPVCRFVQLRAGVLAMPKFALNANLDVAENDFAWWPNEVGIQGKPTMVSGLLMADVSPVPKGSFHFTLGLLFGAKGVMEVCNREENVLQDIATWNASHAEQLGLRLGNYLLAPDETGNIRAEIRVRNIRPYAGIGYGRTVSHGRVGFQVELGCMFWGKPTLHCNGAPIEASDMNGSSGKLVRTLSRIAYYPCLNLRLSGRIF